MGRSQIRQGITRQELLKPTPRSAPSPTTPHQPLPPCPQHFVAKTEKRRAVARDSVIRRVPAKLPAKCRVLLGNGIVAMESAPLGNRPDRPREPIGRGLPLQNPAPLPRARPEVRYDFLPAISPHFVSFAWQYHLYARVSPAARPSAAAPAGILELVTRYLRPGLLRWRRQDILRSWGTPIVLLPALRPRQDRRIRPYDASARPPLCPRRRLPRM